MKICVYCGTRYEDQVAECPNCGGKTFSSTCNNCGTQYEGTVCPKCGVKAGDQGQKCPDCGSLMFNNVCPVCTKRRAEEEAREAARAAEAKRAAETADFSLLSKALIVVVTLIVPCLMNWYTLFNKRTRGGMKAFCVLYSVFYVFALLTQEQGASDKTYYLALGTLPSLAVFGLWSLWKLLRGKKEG